MTLDLTSAQLEIWLAQQLNPDSPQYNLADYHEIRGPLVPELLERAARQAAAEADTVNMRFVTDLDGVPRQTRCTAPWVFHHVDLTEAADPRAEADRWMADDLSRTFDLRHGPLQTSALLTLSRDHHLWYRRYHHIVVDAFSGHFIGRRIAEVYTALVRGEPIGDTPFAPVQRALEDDRRYAIGGRAADDEHWRARLANWPECTRFRSAATTLPPVRRAHRLPEAAVAVLRRHGTPFGLSVPQLLTTAVAAYQHAVTGADDIGLSFVLSARATTALRAVTAPMSNILPVRLTVNAGTTILGLAEQVRTETSQAQRRHRYRDSHRHLASGGARPHFGSMVNVLRFDAGFSFDGHRSVGRNLALGPIEGLAFSFDDRMDGNGIEVELSANPVVHSEEEVATHLRRFLRWLAVLPSITPDTPVGEADVFGDGERAAALAELCQGPIRPVTPRRVHDLISDQTARTPCAIAVSHGERTMTYRELDRASDGMAVLLRRRGVRAGDLVAVAMHREPELLVALLGIWKAGAAYLPVDVDLPAERIRQVLTDSGVAVAVTGDGVPTPVSEALRGVPELLLLDPGVVDALPAFSGELLGSSASPADLAYVIYTSGSTGRPKGVAVEHRSVCAYLDYATTAYPGTRGTATAHSPVGFDLTVTALLAPLTCGGRVHLGALDEPRPAPEFLKITPAHLTLLTELPASASPTRDLVIGGEQLLGAALKSWRDGNPDAVVTNEYGPTEATVGCCTFQLRPGDPVPDGALPVGRPIPSTRLYVLDARLRVLPAGCVGELYIAGAGLARGYLGRPAETAHRFVADPFGPDGSRMYRTGDLAVFRLDGELEFLGRADGQVKVRGHRIELSEVDAVLTAHPAVRQAATTVDSSGEPRLVGYLVPVGEDLPDLDDVTAHVARSLPRYMVPAVLVVVDALPLTPNGKLDRRALPAPHSSAPAAGSAGRSVPEQLLCEFMAELLDVPRVRPDDDLIALGGSSLTAQLLVYRVRTVLGLTISLGDVLRCGTAAKLARRLSPATDLPALRPRPRPAGPEVSHAQHRLWYLTRLHGLNAAYNLADAHRVSGPLDRAALGLALGDLTRRHEVLRTAFTGRARPEPLVLDPVERWPVEEVESTEDSVAEDIARAAAQPFRLDADAPFRATLFRLGPDDHVLLLALHHIAGDGWSYRPLHRELAQAYAARTAGRTPDWSPLAVDYGDYAVWQREVLDAGLAERQADYWATALAGAPDQLSLPADRRRPDVPSQLGGYVPVTFTREQRAGLTALARQTNTTLFMVLQAGLGIALRRLGAGDDIPIGTPVSGRPDGVTADLVGCFVNTVVLRTRVDGSASVRDLLASVREVDLAAFAHQDLPFDRVVAAVGPRRSAARNPLFQVMLTFDGAPAAPLELAGTDVAPLRIEARPAKFDLTLDLTDAGGVITGVLDYATDLFDADTAERIASCVTQVLDGMAAAPELPVDRIAASPELVA
ncbi:hypothetical protein BBK82_35400 [Lentzea guizhouensis]|uniref:Carrier domain-containing protein n=1 Tax=Lentzea guizhouensis TaxID=1586287 RepID=A0A1B2HS09_9PSEU|nr:non-ribosomal peptide synthetase [Lentzea guizhouensis]ANZ40514.1 hypothetical protein BBK82_35400 [Lentzea guizhouensis]